MTTNPDVLRLAREIAASSTTFKLFKDAYLRGDNDNSLIVLVAIAAIERTTQLAVNYAAYQGSSLLYGLKALDHLRQPEKGSTDDR